MKYLAIKKEKEIQKLLQFCRTPKYNNPHLEKMYIQDRRGQAPASATIGDPQGNIHTYDSTVALELKYPGISPSYSIIFLITL